MKIKQISVFVENRKGTLYKLSKALSDNNIDLKALSIADTSKFGIMRCIVNNAEEALEVIKNANFTANITEVLAVEVADKPGGLALVLEVLDKEDINVEYLYSFVRSNCDGALIILRVEEVERAIEAFEKSNLKILTNEEVTEI
ncbi:MAG: ACT domain-containing protein [Christensenellaceae bacterium]